MKQKSYLAKRPFEWQGGKGQSFLSANVITQVLLWGEYIMVKEYSCSYSPTFVWCMDDLHI